MSKVRVRFKRITFWHRPFELDIEVNDGEGIDEALERHWCAGFIPGAAEREAEANEIHDYEVVQEAKHGH